MRRDITRVVLAGLGFGIAAAYALAASRLRTPAFSDPVGPRTFPYLIAAGLALASLALLAEHLAARRRGETERPEGVTGIGLISIGLLAGYCLLFEPLGFIASTALFLMAFLTVTERTRPRRNLAIALIFPVLTWVVLGRLLGAPLAALPA